MKYGIFLLLMFNIAFAAEPAGNPVMSFLPLILIVVVFYFFLIRPQQKRAKEHKALIADLKKGDEVSTNAGIYGKVALVKDGFIVLEVAPKVEIKIQKQAVVNKLPKNTLKELN